MFFTGELRHKHLAIYDTTLTTTAEEWRKLKWWQRLLVYARLKKRPLGQVEALAGVTLNL